MDTWEVDVIGAKQKLKTPPAEKTDRQRRAYELSLRGHPLREIAAIMKSEGYLRVGHETVRLLLKAEHEAIVLPLAAEHVKRQYERLEQMRLHVMGILERAHVTVNNGKVIYLDGRPVIDDAPELAALDRLLKIEDRIAKLFGIDAPTQAHVTVVQTTETDEKIRELTEAMDAADDAPAVADVPA